MKTIEERGLRYVESQCNGCRNEEKKGRYIGYIQGATEQKAIDIDKACEWLKSYRQETPDGLGYIAGIVNDKTIDDFRKAMEE